MVMEGTAPPVVCAACQHAQAYYEPWAENYALDLRGRKSYSSLRKWGEKPQLCRASQRAVSQFPAVEGRVLQARLSEVRTEERSNDPT